MKGERYVFYSDERARCVIDFLRGRAFLHLEVRKFGVETLLEIRARWPALKVILKTVGFKIIYAYAPEENAEKLLRFAKPFGFIEIKRRGGLILMGVNNG